jgi:hypothetical protein
MRRTLHGAPETVNLSTTSTARAARLCGGDAMGMVMHLRRIALGAGALALTLAATAAKADPIPPGGQGEHVRVIGFSGLGGHFGGFKIAIKHTAGDKWYLFTGHSFNQGWSIVDVTDPANPRYVKFIPFATDDKSIITSQVTLHDNLMLTSLNSFEPQKNPLPAVLLWDISDPENPKQVGSWQGGVTGAHRNSYPGGKYAYLSTSYPGFKANIMVVLDVSDPAHPKDVGKWWQPGQKDGEPASPYPEGFHGPVNMSPDGKWATLPYTPDLVNLDLSDPTNPKLIGKVHFTEPFASVGIQSVHTVLPLWDRKLAYVSSEAQKPECKDDGMNFAGLVDNSDPAKPRLISIFPTPRPPVNAPYRDFCEKGGRFGPHNTSQEIHNPAIQQPGNLIDVAWFNAGLRVFDISDPQLPTEVAYFMPPERPELPGQSGAHASPINWSEEIAVDARGNIYMNDDKWGLWIMRYTGNLR